MQVSSLYPSLADLVQYSPPLRHGGGSILNKKPKGFFILEKIEEENPEFWRAQGAKALQAALNRKLNTNVARNIMLYLGDGMGITTITAARILKGQMHKQSGEETVMTMDTFPHAGLLKTYSVDFQIPDSSSTAYLCGVKTNLNTVGVNAAARNGICKTQKGNEVTSILKWAKDAGKSVGIVTTTRVQHATPAATYAHSASRRWYSDADVPAGSGTATQTCQQEVVQRCRRASRKWYSDADVPAGGGTAMQTCQQEVVQRCRRASRKWYSDADVPASAKKEGCTDITSQLLNNTDIDVSSQNPSEVLVPQRHGLQYPRDMASSTTETWPPVARDKMDATSSDWQKMKALFEPGDLRFDVERDPTMDPSIAETTEKAIHVLNKNPKRFFLLVEASMALHETVAFDNAVAKGLELTNEEETLTLVTADHSHAFTFNGYHFRGQSILGKSPLYGKDMLPYTTLMYGNGPGYKVVDNKRPDIRKVDTKSKDYVQLSAVPLDTETHGGEDVVVRPHGPPLPRGPGAELPGPCHGLRWLCGTGPQAL
ncbi:unnamed protein product [Coregonus sp. 'balchen']|nr:unnamed protein product [Coregonus sp. 'balchen']